MYFLLGHGSKNAKHSFVSVRLDDFLVWGEPLGQLGILHGQLLRLLNLTLALVERLSLHLPLGLQGGHDVLVLPANLRTAPS